ncbi:hypothetical protein T459_05002 [Capsicum annuum]|uniref:SWIM-type domain-containing protein n=1 Tax=Capsicum annuum TaxID=4072 RepID=A0A2G3A6K6_CAPAN|nr:hypothetical protein T459_05002 [Capsicum annuum]
MEIVSVVEKELTPNAPLPSVYKIITIVMLRSGCKPGRGLGKNLQGIIEPITVLEKASKYGLGYQTIEEDKIKDELKMSLPRPLSLLYQSFFVREMSNDDGIGNLFKGCNVVPEDFPKSNGVKKVAPGEAFQNWTSTPLITHHPSCNSNLKPANVMSCQGLDEQSERNDDDWKESNEEQLLKIWKNLRIGRSPTWRKLKQSTWAIMMKSKKQVANFALQFLLVLETATKFDLSVYVNRYECLWKASASVFLVFPFTLYGRLICIVPKELLVVQIPGSRTHFGVFGTLQEIGKREGLKGAGVTSESLLGKTNNDKQWASDIAVMGSGTKHESVGADFWKCASLSTIPRGKWYCKYCESMLQREKFVEHNANALAAGRVSGVDSIEQITNRCIRSVKNAEEAEFIACVLCRAYDFSKSGFGPRTVILCDQCEKEYHVGCLKKSKIADLKNLFWFLVISWENGWRLRNVGNGDHLPRTAEFISTPPRCPTVDDDLIDDDLNGYENDVDDTINMEDYSMHMEDFSSDSQDDEEDRETESQTGHSFTDGTNFYCGQTFVDKKGAMLISWLWMAVAVKKVRHLGQISHIQKLKSIIEDEPDLCVISDRHISIANAFSHVYSRAHHGFFMRHLAENLCVNQHCGEHLYLFYAAAKAYSFDEFSDNFVELKSKCPEAAHVLKNVLGFEKWSRAHFLGNRYDVMTTNIAESLNSILMDEREYPVSYIFNSIAKKFSEKFRDGMHLSLTVFGNNVTAKVNLLERICSCRKFNLVKMSCEHAMAVLRAKYDDGEDYGNSIYDYSSPIYKAESYLLAYSEAINVVPPEAEWTVPQELVDTKISPPSYDPKLGRKKVKHTKSVGETFKSKRRNRCSICKKSGYKRTTCRMGIKS